ncbi:MAG: hypothetical protein M1818_005043 [Claussenomyces sp. TS43310]|nr:MAG: hypothetical protein M1818_005043 [Claussenomyces sp. TS43310]
MQLNGLSAAEKMDPGNYKTSEYTIYPFIAQAAGEYRDEKLRRAALESLEKNIGYETTTTGARKLKSGSFFLNMTRVRAELLRYQDWKKLIAGPSKTALAGPILSDVPYPGVLVAKARSHTSRDLELVLYTSGPAGSFDLGIGRLQPDQKYSYEGGEIVAGPDGKTQLTVMVSGRTKVNLTPV